MHICHINSSSLTDIRAIRDESVTHPAMMIASDAVFWSYFDDNGMVLNYGGNEWPLPENVFSHPRSSGAFAKVFIGTEKSTGKEYAIKQIYDRKKMMVRISKIIVAYCDAT